MTENFDRGWAVDGVSNARARLDDLTYLATRTLEFLSAWLPSARASELKIDLGRGVGYVAETLSALDRRRREIAAPQAVTGRGSDERFLCSHLHVAEDAEIQAAGQALLDRMTTALAEAIEALSASRSGILDEPTLTALKSSPLPWPLGRRGCAIDDEGAGDKVALTDKLPLPPLPKRPARGAGLRPRTEPLVAFKALAHTPEGRAQIIHDLYIDIEISAAEVCAMNIVLYRAMPLAFRLDMARQVWDEIRHADLAKTRACELADMSADQPYTLNVWNRWISSHGLVDKLIVQQIVQEGNALDAGLELAALFRDNGDEQSAGLFEFFSLDEEIHARIGNRWVLEVLENDHDQYIAALDRVAGAIGASVPGRALVDEQARARAGFSVQAVKTFQARQSERV